jgi:hypothetical protein
MLLASPVDGGQPGLTPRKPLKRPKQSIGLA